MDGSRLGITWPLLKSNGVSRTFKHLFRAGYVLIANLLMGSPLANWEKRNFAKKIAETELEKPPVFIIGHWRSGTTFLHNLMSLDKRFGYLCNSHALLPYATFLKAGIVRKLVDFHLMPKRPMDDVVLSPDGPQEEEFVLASLYGEGAYLGWYFPERFEEYFERYTLLEDLTSDEKSKFADDYKMVIKKASLANKGRQLVLKNPVNTGRVKMLLEQFPNAKFIYLERDSAEVYHSTIRLHEKLIESFSFQKYVPEKLGDFVINFYQKILKKYETEKQLIPKDQLIEVDYKDLTRQPIETLRQIYETLHLPDFEVAESAFVKYTEKQKKTYRPAKYQISQQEASQLRLAMVGQTTIPA